MIHVYWRRQKKKKKQTRRRRAFSATVFFWYCLSSSHSYKQTETSNDHTICIVSLKLAFFSTVCVFGSIFYVIASCSLSVTESAYLIIPVKTPCSQRWYSITQLVWLHASAYQENYPRENTMFTEHHAVSLWLRLSTKKIILMKTPCSQRWYSITQLVCDCVWVPGKLSSWKHHVLRGDIYI